MGDCSAIYRFSREFESKGASLGSGLSEPWIGSWGSGCCRSSLVRQQFNRCQHQGGLAAAAEVAAYWNSVKPSLQLTTRSRLLPMRAATATTACSGWSGRAGGGWDEALLAGLLRKRCGVVDRRPPAAAVPSRGRPTGSSLRLRARAPGHIRKQLFVLTQTPSPCRS